MSKVDDSKPKKKRGRPKKIDQAEIDALRFDKPKKSKTILDEFDEVESMSSTLIGSYFPKSRKKDFVEQIDEANNATDDWAQTIANFKQPKISGIKRSQGGFDIFQPSKKDKKKKGKDKKDNLIDYAREFEPELNLTKNLLADQSQFTESLQRRYNILDGSKSSARGVGKYTTDLINAITQSRSASRQLVNDMVSIKKTIADLNMKQKKEMGGLGGDAEDMGNFSATFLRKMIQQSRDDAYLYGSDTPIEGSADDIFDNLSDRLSDDDRDDDVNKFLQYENRNVKIIAAVDKNDKSKYELQAYAEDGERIYDYPIPDIEQLNVNESTETASDEYYNKYQIKWVG